MRLQRLELNGFKSFSDRVELLFDRGVTAIVGPNGCGKSNVADAIVWVMGEQSAKSLRGDRMEDVIFSGSDARKPTAAAEVRLLLAGVTNPLPFERGNGHGAGNGASGGGAPEGNGHQPVNGENGGQVPAAREVEVTRRLYRSGESEYLINGETCRLRDVHELLMDTGLGAKNYAIIEQGKIGQILGARPIERRQIIEEAAGVTKYKARRRAAELKLEAAQQNLTRVDDIVVEVERQRSALKRQAARARRYRRLREQLRRWEKVLFARRSRHLAQTIEEARAQLAAARAVEAGVAGELAREEQDLARARLARLEIEAAAGATRERAHAQELEMDRRASQIEFNARQMAELEARVRQIEQDIAELTARQDPVRRAAADSSEAAARGRRERDQAALQLAAEIDAHRLAQQRLEGLEADVEAARSEVFAAINAATALRHVIEHAEAARTRVAEQVSKLNAEAHDLERDLDQAEQARARAAAALLDARAALEALRGSRAAHESSLATVRIEHGRREQELRAREQEVARYAARLASLEELDAARAGYADAARLVLAESHGAIQQRGSVADYLTVPERFERAVEACLGELLQYVVVDTHAHAATALEFVRSRGAGVCGCVVAGGGPSQAGRDPDTNVGGPGLVPLSSVVEVTGPAAGAIRRAIGEGWIARTWDEALAAAPSAPGPVVTLAGEVFRGAHVVSGGRREETRGILSMKREIKELSERLGAERSGVAALAAEVQALDEQIATLAASVAVLQAEEHRQEKEILSRDLHLKHLTEEIERLTRKRDVVATETRSAREESGALERRMAEAREAITRLEADQHAADERLGLAQRRLFEGRELAESLAQRVADARAAHAALIERAAALEAEVVRFEESAQDLERRRAAASDERVLALARQDALRAANAALDRQLVDDHKTLDSLRAEMREAEERLSQARQQTDASEQTIRDLRRRLEEVRARVTDLEVARATAESDLAHLAEACRETLQLSLEDVVAEVGRLEADGEISADWRADAGAAVPDETEDADDSGSAEHTPVEPGAPMTPEDAIANLREKLDRLGPVNMMAIEQFDELEARHEFLTAQRRDLVESIASVTEAIRRIDQTTRARFREAFDAINQHFQQTFSMLFGGGRAGLALIDDQDLLESGIEIIAQPPGKRLQNVQLLSGGEKALTAMSLMFALFRYKPSPFCLLDEIDAPLDDANIGRFVEMLRSMQDQTQFILITHNRKTMEIADRLYGITMEEPGVSKLISVRLN